MIKKANVIKKIKKGLKLATAATLIVTTLASCGMNNYSFGSQNKIVEHSQVLECDMSYMHKYKGNFIRMRHNQGEPIYVCFDDEYSEKLKGLAEESLDYIFGIVGKINDDYCYEIVNLEEFYSKEDKTKIYYGFDDSLSDGEGNKNITYGQISRSVAWTNFDFKNPVYTNYEIDLNKDQLENKTEKEIKYTLNHELLHALGFEDVYTQGDVQTTTKFYGNTLINNRTKFDIITPNDLACLISLYADTECDIKKMKQEVEKYENKFYQYFAQMAIEKLGITEEFSYTSFDWSARIVKRTEEGNRLYENKVTVKDGRYKLEIFNKISQELIDSCEGEVFNHNGVMILKDVLLRSGIDPCSMNYSFEGGYVHNLIFAKNHGDDVLYNFYIMEGVVGNVIEHEKSLTQ